MEQISKKKKEFEQQILEFVLELLFLGEKAHARGAVREPGKVS